MLLMAWHAALATALQPASTCHVIRLVDKNMDEVEKAALRGGGLDHGGGRYLSASEVADISGLSHAEIGGLQQSLSVLGCKFHLIGPLRDAISVCLTPQAGADLISNFPPLPSKNDEAQAQALSRTFGAAVARSLHAALSQPTHGQGHLIHVVTHMNSTEPKEEPGMASLNSNGRGLKGRIVEINRKNRKRPTPSQPAPASPSGLFSILLNATIHGPVRGAALQEGDPTAGILIFNASSIIGAVGIPLFNVMSPLVYAGTSNYSYLMRNAVWENHIVSFMVPCSAILKSSQKAAIVKYASTSTGL